MRQSRSFAELLAATAQHKLAAAQARQHPNPEDEKPKDAILDGLSAAALDVSRDGFTFSRSDPKFSRKSGDFTFTVSIQSDRNNVAGQRAAIWAHVAVYSKSLNAWRKQHHSEWIRPRAPFPIPLFATQLGYLCQPAGWAEWDFADPAKRSAVAADLVRSIRSGAYPLFAHFDGPLEGIATISQHDWPSPEGVLSYLLAKGASTLATETLDGYLSRNPAFKAEFQSLMDQFAREGLPSFRAGAAHDLAAFAVSTGFPWAEAKAA